MGLFEHPFPMEDTDSVFLLPGDVDAAKKSAEESLVLLKNDGVLPLADTVKTIAVIGCHAGTARYLFGGYTHYSMAEGNIARMLESRKLNEDMWRTIRDWDADYYKAILRNPIGGMAHWHSGVGKWVLVGAYRLGHKIMKFG